MSDANEIIVGNARNMPERFRDVPIVGSTVPLRLEPVVNSAEFLGLPSGTATMETPIVRTGDGGNWVFDLPVGVYDVAYRMTYRPKGDA